MYQRWGDHDDGENLLRALDLLIWILDRMFDTHPNPIVHNGKGGTFRAGGEREDFRGIDPAVLFISNANVEALNTRVRNVRWRPAHHVVNHVLP